MPLLSHYTVGCLCRTCFWEALSRFISFACRHIPSTLGAQFFFSLLLKQSSEEEPSTAIPAVVTVKNTITQVLSQIWSCRRCEYSREPCGLVLFHYIGDHVVAAEVSDNAPHGNAKKSTQPFLRTLPIIMQEVKEQSVMNSNAVEV